MVLVFENSRVFRYSDPLFAPFIFVRDRTYPVIWDYSAWKFILVNGFIGDGKFPFVF